MLPPKISSLEQPHAKPEPERRLKREIEGDGKTGEMESERGRELWETVCGSSGMRGDYATLGWFIYWHS